MKEKMVKEKIADTNKEKIPKRLKGFGAVVRLGRGLTKHLTPETDEFYWWRNKGLELFWFLILLTLNFCLVSPLFGQEFRYSFSAPLIPFLAGVISFVFPLSQEAAVNTVVLIAYSLAPLALYFLVKETTKRLLSAVSAALIFSSPLLKSRLLSIFSIRSITFPKFGFSIHS